MGRKPEIALTRAFVDVTENQRTSFIGCSQASLLNIHKITTCPRTPLSQSVKAVFIIDISRAVVEAKTFLLEYSVVNLFNIYHIGVEVVANK